MGARTILSALVLVLSGTVAHSADLVLLWDFPKRYGTPTWTLTVVRTSNGETAQAQVVVTALDEGACQRLTGKTLQELGEEWRASLRR